MRVTKDALRHVRAGHPWVYEASVTSTSHEASPGDLAVVFDDRRRFAAIGLWDPDSPIRVKILHAGAPTPIDAGFWTARLSAAADRRAPLVGDPATAAYRLVHGENDGLPGLVVDRYAGVVVVKLYSPAWFPHLRSVVTALEGGPVVLRLSRAVAAGQAHGLRDGTVIVGSLPPGPVLFRENGLVMECSPTARPEDRSLPRPARQPGGGPRPGPRGEDARRLQLHRRVHRARRRRGCLLHPQRRRVAPRDRRRGPQPPAQRPPRRPSRLGRRRLRGPCRPSPTGATASTWW